MSSKLERLIEAANSVDELRERVLHVKFSLAPDDAPMALLWLDNVVAYMETTWEDLNVEIEAAR